MKERFDDMLVQRLKGLHFDPEQWRQRIFGGSSMGDPWFYGDVVVPVKRTDDLADRREIVEDNLEIANNFLGKDEEGTIADLRLMEKPREEICPCHIWANMLMYYLQNQFVNEFVEELKDDDGAVWEPIISLRGLKEKFPAADDFTESDLEDALTSQTVKDEGLAQVTFRSSPSSQVLSAFKFPAFRTTVTARLSPHIRTGSSEELNRVIKLVQNDAEKTGVWVVLLGLNVSRMQSHHLALILTGSSSRGDYISQTFMSWKSEKSPNNILLESPKSLIRFKSSDVDQSDLRGGVMDGSAKENERGGSNANMTALEFLTKLRQVNDGDPMSRQLLKELLYEDGLQVRGLVTDDEAMEEAGEGGFVDSIQVLEMRVE